MRIPVNEKLNYLLEFEDRQMEREYAQSQTVHSLPYMRTLVFILGIVYFMFFIADYLTGASQAELLLILANRMLVCLMAFGAYWWLSVSKRYECFYAVYNVGLIITAASFIVICLSYEKPNFLRQTLEFIAIILVVFMIPNRWRDKVMVALSISAAYFVVLLLARPQVAVHEIVSGVVYTLLIVALRAVSTYNNELQRRLRHLNGKQLEIMSKTDSMTGLYNRETLNEDLAERIAAVQRVGPEFGIVLFDIDDFKVINDTYGHLVGDRVLLEIVDLIERALPQSCPMYRWGGEEFIILFPDCTEERCVELSNHYCRLIHDTPVDGIGITCSFGVSCYRAGDTIETLLARTDKNLYIAKGLGKNCVVANGISCAEADALQLSLL